MRIVLEVQTGPHAGKRIQLTPGQAVRVGRTAKADFATQDTYMSGVHFIIECTQTSCRLSDLNSRNGTLINDEPMTKTVTLRDGDRIFAGQTNFVVHLEATEQPARPSQPTTVHQAETVSDMSPVPLPPAYDISQEDSITPLKPIVPPSPPAHFQGGRDEGQPFPAKTDYGTVPFRAPNIEPPPRASEPPATLPTPTPTPRQQQPPQPTPPPQRPAESASAPSASTPKGRLLAILREQPEPLYALVDALSEPKLLELLRGSGEHFSPLYEGGQHAPEKIPYLVSLSGGSRLLETLVEHGWGKNWGVYLTCSASLADLRQYYREKLMVKVGNMEFIFRFYEPRFMRETLRSSTYNEATKFFGPVSHYFIEAENPEVLLQFTKGANSIDLKERILLLSGT
jgi:pSer/pThr/pTyr-binding forkhead associated (FHA) protein